MKTIKINKSSAFLNHKALKSRSDLITVNKRKVFLCWRDSCRTCSNRLLCLSGMYLL